VNDGIEDMAERFNSKADFIRFLKALKEDADANSEGWENPSLPTFVEAMSAWAEDSCGYYNNFGIEIDTSKPSWRFFADILLAARVYE
jgi:hypothetical protein